MNMLIVSQNMTNYDVDLPEDVIYRINLAWINDLQTLKEILSKHKQHQIFLDLPINRTKPPNNKYSMEQIKPILEKYKNIKYFAISNVDSQHVLTEFLEYIPKNILGVFISLYGTRSYFLYILSFKCSNDFDTCICFILYCTV